MPKICIILPCYNEEKRLPIPEIITSYETYNYSYLFVNDGSTDDTLNLLNTLKDSREDRISILNLEKNTGKAEAIRQGVLKITAEENFDIIGYLDADLAIPLTEVSYIISPLKDDIIFTFGSRIKIIGSNVKRKLLRHIISRTFATIASNLLKVSVYDTQCGVKFFDAKIAKIAFKAPFKTRWLFDIELFFRISSIMNTQINNYAKEIPLINCQNKPGSKIKFRHYLNIPIELIKIYKHYRFFKK